MTSFLPTVWFVLILFLLAGYAILDGFDLGAGFWTLWAREEKERKRIMAQIKPFWDGNEVWLLAGAGALFAAFPFAYATLFSGFYFPMILVIFCLMGRAVSLEVREKSVRSSWQNFWGMVFGVGSSLPMFLFGVVVGNLVQGVPLDSLGNFSVHGFELLWPFPMVVGFLSLSMLITHGVLFLGIHMDDSSQKQIQVWAKKSWFVYFVLALVGSIWTLLGNVSSYFSWEGIFFVLGLGGMLGIRFWVAQKKFEKAFWFSCFGIAAWFGFLGFTLFPNLVKASNDPWLSVTLFNSSSSPETLKAMLIIALIGMPLVLGYTFFVYRIFWKRKNS